MKHIIDDADKNKYEAYTKQEVLNVIQEAISSGELPEEINGLVLTFKNPVDNQGYKIAFCTQAQYNTMVSQGTLETNCYYYITDDTTLDTLDDMQDDITDLDSRVTSIEAYHMNSTLTASATTSSTDCTFLIMSTSKNVIVREGNLVFVEYDVQAMLDLNSGYMVSGTAYGDINITIPNGFRPSIATPLNITYTSTGDMTSRTAIASKVNTNGTMTITCSGSYSDAYSDTATFTIRLYGVYTIL